MVGNNTSVRTTRRKKLSTGNKKMGTKADRSAIGMPEAAIHFGA
jgi:hypothetical protein